MAQSYTQSVTYTTTQVPADDPNVPVLWHFTLEDSHGNVLASPPPQVFTTPPPPGSITWNGLGGGTYVSVGGQKNAAGAEVGTLIVSRPFDVTVPMVDAVYVSAIA